MGITDYLIITRNPESGSYNFGFDIDDVKREDGYECIGSILKFSEVRFWNNELAQRVALIERSGHVDHTIKCGRWVDELLEFVAVSKRFVHMYDVVEAR